MGDLVARATTDGCTDGTCPTFWQDPETGRWELQGFDAPRGTSPAGESRVGMSDDEFRHLIAQVR